MGLSAEEEAASVLFGSPVPSQALAEAGEAGTVVGFRSCWWMCGCRAVGEDVAELGGMEGTVCGGAACASREGASCTAAGGGSPP